jgi:hypothetical protein
MILQSYVFLTEIATKSLTYKKGAKIAPKY